MAIPQNKNELLKAIEGNFEKLKKELVSIPENSIHDLSLEGHAKKNLMSVGNLVSYLIGWNELALKWILKDEANEPIDFPETGFKWNQLGALAQKFYREHEKTPYPQQLQRIEALKTSIIRKIKIRENSELVA